MKEGLHMTIGKSIAANIADDLIAFGVVLGPRQGGMRRERLINLIERIAIRTIRHAPSETLSPAEEIFTHLSAPLLRAREILISNPETRSRARMLDDIDAALARSVRLLGHVAQRIEQPTSNRQVGGSSPPVFAKTDNH
jgi:hypothetical protein